MKTRVRVRVENGRDGAAPPTVDAAQRAPATNKQRGPFVRVEFDDGSVIFRPLEEWRERERRQKEFVGYLAADQRARAAHDATRTAKSTETRRKAAKKHSSIKWLGRAHRENPTFGAERLARRARQMLADKQAEAREGLKVEAKKLAKILKREAKKREEIDEYRARKYLKALRTNSGEM